MEGLLTPVRMFFDLYEQLIRNKIINFAVVNMMSINQLIT